MPRYAFEHETPERLAGIEARGALGDKALFDSLGIGPSRQGTAFDRYSMLAHREVILGTGALTEPEFDGAIRCLEDPGSLVLTPVLYAAWGRKPAWS
jgi:hypothetical protein